MKSTVNDKEFDFQLYKYNGKNNPSKLDKSQYIAQMFDDFYALRNVGKYNEILDLETDVSSNKQIKHLFDLRKASYILKRDKKIEKKTQFSAHKLAPNELLQPEDVIENDNLRWMVFKVKQRGMSKYADKTYTQVGKTDKKTTTPAGYDVSFNWPYDYLSFVEMINMDVEVKMDNAPQINTTKTTIAKTNLPGTINQAKINEALEDKIIENVLNTSGILK